jgi:hypothetical protein
LSLPASGWQRRHTTLSTRNSKEAELLGWRPSITGMVVFWKKSMAKHQSIDIDLEQ